MAEQVPGSEIVANRLAEVLFIQVLRAHIASGPERNKGWLRAIFDPQMGTALSAIHDSVNTPWTVESLAEAAGMSRSAFAARFNPHFHFEVGKNHRMIEPTAVFMRL
jgi:AraC-like DNA-binding protein